MTTKPPSQVVAPPEGNVDKGPLINIFDTWIVALDVIVIVLRFVTRIWITEPRIWWDDWFIFIALICIMIGASGNAVEVRYGFGRPEHFITDHELRYYLAWTYGEWIQTMLTLMCTKVSICFFLLRVPATASRKLAIPLWISIAILLVSNIILTLLWAFQCNPVQAVWRLDIHGKCFSREQVLQMILAQALISIISDFVLSLFPLVILHKLNMKLKSKIGIAILMGLGLITAACSIVRTVLNGKALAGDATYGGLTNWFWRLFEVDLGLICACVPTLVPLYKFLSNRFKRRFRSNASETYSRRYIPYVSWTKGRPSISRKSSRPSLSGGSSLKRTPSRRPDWVDPHPRKPSNNMLASRTERAIMGRGFTDMGSGLRTETELDPIHETTATRAGSDLDPAYKAKRAEEWENSLKMPWANGGPPVPPKDSIYVKDGIEIGRNTSLTVELEPATRSNRGIAFGASDRPSQQEEVGKTENSEEYSNDPDQMRVSERRLGFWRRLGTALAGGEKKETPSSNDRAWRRMHTPRNSEG